MKRGKIKEDKVKAKDERGKWEKENKMVIYLQKEQNEISMPDEQILRIGRGRNIFGGGEGGSDLFQNNALGEKKRGRSQKRDTTKMPSEAKRNIQAPNT